MVMVRVSTAFGNLSANNLDVSSDFDTKGVPTFMLGCLLSHYILLILLMD